MMKPCISSSQKGSDVVKYVDYQFIWRYSNGYHYDAEREYTDFSVDSEPFIDMYYYYGGQPAPTHVGYLGFTGWIVNDEFYVNYGYVNED